MATYDYSRVQHFVGTRLARFLGNSYFYLFFLRDCQVAIHLKRLHLVALGIL